MSEIDIPPPPPPTDTLPLANFAQTVAQESQASHHQYKTFSTSIHAFSQAEKTAFSKHINKVLEDANELKHQLPLDPQSDDIFEAVKEGILLCKLINASVPNTIDESKMIKNFKDDKSKIYHQITNHNLSLEGARKIGAIIVNLGAEDLIEGKPYLVFGLIWQIIKIGMLKEVSLEKHPELAQLGEGIQDLPAEELLLKWFNYHLKKSGVDLRVSNFSSDVKDSIAYLHLMKRLAPELATIHEALQETDDLKRAEKMLLTAEEMGCRNFVTAEDVVSGNERLNLVFVANMFNKHTGMAPITEEMEQENATLQQENEQLKAQLVKIQTQFAELKVIQTKTEQTVQTLSQTQEKIVEEKEGLKKEKDELLKKLEKVFEINEKLTNHIHSINEEKRLVEEQQKYLANQYDDVTQQLQKTAEELEREKISLETSEFCGASLANDLEELRSKHERLEYMIEHLKIERMRSDMHVERLRILYNSFPSTEALCEAIYKSLHLDVITHSASKAGYLTKKARNGNNWKYRYFVLRDNFLFYYKSDKDPHGTPSGVIRVDDAVLKFAENPTRKDLKDQWLLCIEVPNNNDQIKQHAFYISGEDQELEGWKTQIKLAAGWWTKKSRVKVGN